MKKKLFLLVVLFCVKNLSAKTDTLSKSHANNEKKYKNVVIFTASNYSIFKLTQFDPYLLVDERIARQFGVEFEHRVKAKLSIGVGYFTWNTNKYLNRFEIASYPPGHADNDKLDHLYDYRYPPGEKDIEKEGALRFRYGYKMADISCRYRYELKKRHSFFVGTGITYTWGTNIYLDKKVFNYTTNSFDYRLHREAGGYFGLVVPLQYSFVFLHQRLAAGVQSSVRKYFGLYSVTADYGCHIAFNF